VLDGKPMQPEESDLTTEEACALACPPASVTMRAIKRWLRSHRYCRLLDQVAGIR